MINSAPFTASDLREIAGDAASHLPSDLSTVGVSTDSRTLVPGNVFVALQGERFDGHDHVQKAIDGGASLCVVSNAFFNASDPLLREHLLPTSSPLQMLGSFAWYHRRRFHIPVVAIAGAAGKTSTKELTAHLLSQAMHVLKTQANYNNQVGTPLTLLQLTAEHECAVIEIGTNEPGEIEVLCAMVQPTHGLITNIGKEHLEKLIDLDGVEKEETALFDYLHDHDGLAFVNMDDERLHAYAVPGASRLALRRVITFALDTPADIHPQVAYDAELHPTMHMMHGEFTFRAPMHTHGIAGARNAVSAIAIAWSLHLTADEVRAGLTSYQPPVAHGYARMSVERIGSLIVLNDCYNANPESMHLALATLQRYPADRRFAVLGDMRELGATAFDEHMAVLTEAIEVSDLVVAIGDEFRRAVEAIDSEHVFWVNTHEGCAEIVQENAGIDTVVLVKGSRGMTMERVIEHLRGT
ncbi:MAG: UDP-N-acetylmuramoyl-tripeptide--D-alanyl-D-alanine ligase [Bacteroidetes bacterium]|nr:UDP-N-acetylmuramoyl-tripeptide--D-alanyl-D-alanine ligase [Bacteroidota bacterium]